MWIMWIMCAFSPRSLPCAVALWHCQCGILRARTFNYIFIVMADSAAMDWEQLLQMSCKFLSEWYQLAISNTSPLSACHPSAFFSIAVLSLVRTFPQKSCAWLHAMPSMRAGFDQCVHLFGRESHHQWSAGFSSQNFSSEIHTASVAPQLKHVLSLLSTGIFSLADQDSKVEQTCGHSESSRSAGANSESARGSSYGAQGQSWGMLTACGFVGLESLGPWRQRRASMGIVGPSCWHMLTRHSMPFSSVDIVSIFWILAIDVDQRRSRPFKTSFRWSCLKSCSVLLIVAWNGTRSLASKAVSTLSCVKAPSIWTVGSDLELVISGANFPSDVAFLAKLSTLW